MKKKGLIVLASCLALSAIALTGCGHEHSKQSTWTVGDDTHWHACSGCSDKFDETAHVYDQEVATSDYLKAEATASTKAQYWKSCECGKASTTEHFELEKTVATLANIQDLSKTYDGEEVANPTYDTNSNGAVTIEWYNGATKLTSAPANAGTYKVKVIVAESTTHTAISEEKEFTIAKKVLSNLTYNFTYSNSDYYQVVLTSANHSGIIGGEEVTLEVCFEDTIVGSAVDTSSPEMAPTLNDDNYTLGTYTFAITPKTIRVEDLFEVDEFPSKTYDGTNILTKSLTTAHGLIDGDTVGISYSVTEWDGTKDVELVNADTYEYGAYYANDITLTGADAGNYALNTDGYDLGQIMAGVEILSKQIDLGDDGISITRVESQTVYQYTLTTNQGAVEGETVILQVEFANAFVGAAVKPASVKFFVGGIEVGNYNIPIENLGKIKLVNKYGNFDVALVLDCDTPYSETMNINAGQKVYIKINGASGTLNDFYFNATTGSAATFTYEQYNVTDTTTPTHSVTTATNTYYMDVNGTDDLYLVVTCVTAGEISISVA